MNRLPLIELLQRDRPVLRCLCAGMMGLLLGTKALAIDQRGIEWIRLTPVNSPGERIAQATAYDWWRAEAVVFGGDNPLTHVLYTDETWVFANNTWTQRTPAVRPSLRHNAAMAFDSVRGVCVLFGGGDNIFAYQIPQNDTWEWNGTTWTLRVGSDPNATDRPPPLDYPMMSYDSIRQKMVLIAPSERRGADIIAPAKTWEWDGNVWSASNNAPPSRSNGAMAYDFKRQVTVLNGGVETKGTRGVEGDTWTWNGVIWTQVATTGPAPRFEHAMAYDERRGVVTLLAGRSGSTGEFLNDTWEWNGSAWTFYAGADDLGFSPRRLHHLWYDRAEQRLISFGGTWSWTNAEGGLSHTIVDEVFEARPPGRWGDFQYTGTVNNGYFYTPYSTLAAGIAGVQTGATLNLKPGASTENLTITKALQLEAYAGTVTIGR